MPTEELNQKYFTRERVRNRMLKRAAELWGFSESEMDDFDPLVNLLVEAFAVEFEKIAGDIGQTQNRMLERLARLLYPGIVDVNPAYGILQVRSSEPTVILNSDEQFTYKPSGNDRKRENQKAEIFFSPTRATKIFDGSISGVGSARELFIVSDGIQNQHIGSAVKKKPELQHHLWIGLNLNEEINTVDGISFFINWVNQPESLHWFQYLRFTEWALESTPLTQHTGMPALLADSVKSRNLETEFDPMGKIETRVNELFQQHFISLSSAGDFDQLKVVRRTYPKEWELLYDKKSLQELKEPLIWIEVRFPPIIPLEALDSILISMNAFPVINRKLNKFTYKLVPRLNIVPLETEETFLAIKEITNSQGSTVKLIPFANPAGLPSETYTLRYGINRFDERDSKETLINLTELLREESSYFSSLGEDFLIQHIRELNQVLARIEDKVKMQTKNQSPYPYLAIKPKPEGGNIQVEFWSCHGEQANKIPMGSRLLPYKSSHVATNSIFLITPTFGGKDKFNDSEKIDQYKKSLLTHDRIVTMEDLRSFMQTELGQNAKAITYKKTFEAGRRPGAGFIRCMKIEITPEVGSLEPDEWFQRLQDLTQMLEKHSVNNIPYRLNLAAS